MLKWARRLRAAEDPIVVDITECRLTRQVRSASASPARRGRRKPDSAVLDFGAVLAWRLVTPRAKLMVDPRNGARAVIRDTGSDAGGYLWSVLGAGEMRPVSEGRTDELARAESIAEAALRAYAENRVTLPDGFVRSPYSDPEPALEAD